MFIELTKRVSHKLWRQIVKRERRRRIRQTAAQEMQLKYQQEQAALMRDPMYLEELERLQCMEEEAQRLEEEEAKRRKEEWLLRDAALHSKFLNEKRKRELQEEQRMKQEELIKKEWEEKQKLEEDKKKKEQDALLKAATDSLAKGEQLTHNPEPPVGYNRRDFSPPKRESCPFFIKTGACRFGVQCSRDHIYPERSNTILLSNMYTYFGMEHLAMEEKDSDIALEFSESEIYQHFREFFEDVLPEFQRCGKVVQFKVCCNASPHLRGNVYVQFMSEDDAGKACALFNGRWYAGRQMTCYLVRIEKWKSALCGLYWRKQCPKGGHCNFLHAYRNPGNAFWQADKDMQPLGSSRKTTHHRSTSERSSRSRYERLGEASSDRRSYQHCENDEHETPVSRNSRSEGDELSKKKNASHKSRQPSDGSKSCDRLSRSGRSNSRGDKTSRSHRSESKSKRSRSRSRSRNKLERSKSGRLSSKSDSKKPRSHRSEAYNKDKE